MRYVFDTNAVIALMKKNPVFLSKLKQHSPTDIAVPSIVIFELYYGAYKSQKVSENLAKLKRIPFRILPFTLEDAQIAGKIRSELTQSGTPIGGYDTLIAAQAVSRNLILVTHNVREFVRIDELNWEDWLS